MSALSINIEKLNFNRETLGLHLVNFAESTKIFKKNFLQKFWVKVNNWEAKSCLECISNKLWTICNYSSWPKQSTGCLKIDVDAKKIVAGYEYSNIPIWFFSSQMAN